MPSKNKTKRRSRQMGFGSLYLQPVETMPAITQQLLPEIMPFSHAFGMLPHSTQNEAPLSPPVSLRKSIAELNSMWTDTWMNKTDPSDPFYDVLEEQRRARLNNLDRLIKRYSSHLPTMLPGTQ